MPTTAKVDRLMSEREHIDAGETGGLGMAAEVTAPLRGHDAGGSGPSRGLQSPYLWERRAAAQALAERREVEPEAQAAQSDALRQALADSDARVREAAARGLGRLPDRGVDRDRVIEALLGAAEDPNPYVSATAIHGLGLLQAERARPALLAGLEDSNPRVVAAAIAALGRLGPSALGARLLPFLDSTQPYILAAAATALGRLGCPQAGAPLLRNLQTLLASAEARPDRSPQGRELISYQLPRCHIDALVQVRYQPAVPVLIEVARRHVGLRSTAMTALRELDARAAAPALAWMLRDPGAKLRQSLLQLLERADLPETLPFVRPLLEDPAPENRRLAVTLVGRWGDLGALDRVRRMAAAESNPYARTQAVRALTHLLGPPGLAELEPYVQDPNASIRLLMAEWLASLVPANAQTADLLERLACDPEDRIAQTARQALEQQAEQACHRPLLATDRGADPAARALVPAPIRDQARALGQALLSWRQELEAQGAPGASPQAIAEIDQALTHLISALVRVESLPGTPHA